MVKGTVKFFHDRKGYGFIEIEGEDEDEDEDVFFHISELSSETDIEEGTELEFEVEQAEQGPRAVNVTKT